MSAQERHIDHELIARYLAGEATKSEVQDIEQRAASDASFQEELELYRSMWEVSAEEELQVDIDAAWNKVNALAREEPPVISIHRSVSKQRSMWAAAAAVIVLLALPAALWFLNQGTSTTTFSSGTELAHLTLSDGSVIDLSPGSDLKYPEEFAEAKREVWLSGVGYFEVTSNTEQPFFVHTTQGDVRVVGTAFEIDTRSVEDGLSVEVEEGIVEVATLKKDVVQRVTAGESAKLSNTDNTIQVVEDLSPDAFFWKDRTIKFKRTELDRVIQTLSDSYNVKIALRSEQIAGCELSATFSDEEIENILDVIATTLRLEWEKDGDTYYFSGEGC